MRAIAADQILCVADTGRFVRGDSAFAHRLIGGRLDDVDRSQLEAEGLACPDNDALAGHAYDYDLAQRIVRAGSMDYLILVPTLRCNLSCSYCQVSRAAENASGFDWSESTLDAVLSRLDEIPGDRIKIEFQGGEPTLRPDLIEAVISRSERFPERQFVICTNLQHVDERISALFDRDDVHISTSLDGDALTHQTNRTASIGATESFRSNLTEVIRRYGPAKVGALPTINPLRPPAIDKLINSYADMGFNSIYLRPINYHGFARKRHQAAQAQDGRWYSYQRQFLMRLIERNWEDRSRVLEEAYFTLCIRRIFQPGQDRHVDLRSPNPMGHDYVVIDHDGRVYPTDEARMLARSGIIDLAIGTAADGWDTETRDLLNQHCSNQFDPACQRCAYQPFCGRDVVDDLARYGRIDLPRHETEFCRRHTALFDLAFELIYSPDEAVQYSLRRWLGIPGDAIELGPRLQ